MDGRTILPLSNVSKLGLVYGLTGAYNDPVSDESGISMITYAFSFSKGITFFDTADIYGANYANDFLVGKALKQLPREKAQLTTKFGIAGMRSSGVSVKGIPEYVRACCEASLERLDVDYIDLYYQHRVDTSLPIEKLEEERREGGGADGGGRSSCEDEPDATATTASGAAQRSGKSGRRAVAWMAVIARSSDASNAARRPAVGSAPAGRRHSRSDEIGGQPRTSRRGGVEQRLRASSRVAARRGERCQHGSDGGQAAPARRRDLRRSDGGGGQLADQRRGGSNERVGSAAMARESGAGERSTAAPAPALQRQRRGSGGDAVNGAVARCRPVGCRNRDDAMEESGVGCANRDASDVLRFAISRGGPLASESWLLFICDMSSYPDAVDISQLSVRWGHLSGFVDIS
ncbi:hypothetical protein Scep_009713 [Stephania cephalantha]|uniref:NADP-dependent oxidoreductase domain-containing protein n=1 Tax=Stephania cephalantha TaxID=152367 RepID=A0AAP0PDE6_9MAGN